MEEAGHCSQQLHYPAHDEVLVLARPLAQHTPETVQQVSNLYIRYIRKVDNLIQQSSQPGVRGIKNTLLSRVLLFPKCPLLSDGFLLISSIHYFISS